MSQIIISQLIPSSYNVFCYVIKGKGHFGKDRIEAEKGKAVIFKKDGKHVPIRSAPNSKSPLEILFIAGIPLNEPVAWNGPFVMNINAKINQAVENYQNGKLKTTNFWDSVNMSFPPYYDLEKINELCANSMTAIWDIDLIIPMSRRQSLEHHPLHD